MPHQGNSMFQYARRGPFLRSSGWGWRGIRRSRSPMPHGDDQDTVADILSQVCCSIELMSKVLVRDCFKQYTRRPQKANSEDRIDNLNVVTGNPS